MYNISQSLKNGENLAASLEMLVDWQRLVNDQVTNKVLRLLHIYDTAGGTRRKLIRVLQELKEVVLAEE